MKLDPQALAEKARHLYDESNRVLGGTPAILAETLRTFSLARASEAAASISYYAMFSLFPLALAVITAGSFFLEKEMIQQRVLEWVATTLPTAQDLIIANLRNVLEQRGSVGVIALLGLLWSGSGVLNTLAQNINRAYPESRWNHFLHARLVALGMAAGLAVLLLLSFFVSTTLDLLPSLGLPIISEDSPFSHWLIYTFSTGVLPFVLRLFMFWGLYFWVPNTAVRKRAALAGALFAALGWQLVTFGFTRYLSSGLASYELMYGSLGTIIALMLWVYLSAWIALFGAHLSASISRAVRNRVKPVQMARPRRSRS